MSLGLLIDTTRCIGCSACAAARNKMNRLNVNGTGMEGAAGARYFPSWMEIGVSLHLVALGFT